MRKKRLISALGAFFVLAIGLAGCGSGVPGNSVADMAGNPITVQAFNHWMVVAAKSQAVQNPGQPVIVPTDPPQFNKCVANIRAQIPQLASMKTSQLRADCKQLFTALSGTVMDFLIKAYWYQAEATRDHIKVSDAQVRKVVNSAVSAQFPDPAQFQSFLNATGQTMQDILYRFRVQQVYSKLLSKQATNVTPAQIKNYYSSHLSQFGTPESRDIRIVLTKDKAHADQAKAALASGQSWNDVANKFSTDSATKSKGGLLTGVTQGSQDTALDTAAFKAPLNQLEGPVQGEFGFYVFQVVGIKKGTQQSLAQATPIIRQTLITQNQTSAQSNVDKVTRKHWLSQTHCRSDYAMSDCSGFKAPTTNTATAPGQNSGAAPQNGAGAGNSGAGAGNSGAGAGNSGAGAGNSGAPPPTTGAPPPTTGSSSSSRSG